MKFGLLFSSANTSSSSEPAPPSLSSSSLPSSSSLSGAPNALAGLVPTISFSFPGAAKDDSFGPAPPANPLPSLDPNTLPLDRPPNPEVVPLPKPKPDAGLSPVKAPNPLAGVVDDKTEGFPAKAPKPDDAG